MTSATPCSADRLQGRSQLETLSGLNVEWGQNVQFMGRQLKLGMKADGNKDLLGVREVKLGSGLLQLGSVLSLTGEINHDFTKQNTHCDLIMIGAGGTMLTIACDGSGRVDELSMFHRAGPVNIQPRWLRTAQLCRLHIGRGGAFRRCPVSMQADVPLGEDGRLDPRAVSTEFKCRKQLGPGRQLRAVWLASKRAAILELVDTATDRDGAWVVRARSSYGDGLRSIAAPELTLKRKWHW